MIVIFSPRTRDRIRCWFLPRSHRRRIRSARRTLRKVRPWLAEPAGPARMFGYLRKIDALAFEELTLQAFVDMGWHVRRGTRYSGDGGIDGHVRMPGDLYWTAIQCKRYSSAINPAHVRDFARLIYPHRGFFVHTGRTGGASWDARRGSGVVVVSGEKLVALIDGRFEFPRVQLKVRTASGGPSKECSP